MVNKRRSVNTISSNRLLKSSATENGPPRAGKLYTTKGGDDFTLEKKRDQTGGDTIVLKNGTEIIDIPLSSVREKLVALYEVRNVRISQLSVDHRQKFFNLTTIMQGLRNSSSYTELVSLIDEVFSKGTGVILPGTINAYLNGCKANTNFTPFACSPICSASAQPVDMGDGWTVCDKYTVLFDEKDSRFTMMNNPVDKEDAYIFVSSSERFVGFTASEKDALSSKGIKRVMIVSYDQTGKNTTNISDDFVPLENIKSKVEAKKPNNGSGGGGGGSSWSGWYVFFWVVVIVIVLLAIALLIYFIVMATRKKKQMTISEELFESMMSDSYGENDLARLARTPRSRIATSMTENL